VVVITRKLMKKSSEIQTRWDALRGGYQREVARTLASRLPPSAALVAEMVNAAVLAAYTGAVDRWASDGGTRPQTEYTLPALKRAAKLFEAIDKEYVLR
jgi:hypothetical protein